MSVRIRRPASWQQDEGIVRPASKEVEHSRPAASTNSTATLAVAVFFSRAGALIQGGARG